MGILSVSPGQPPATTPTRYLEEVFDGEEEEGVAPWR